MRRWVALLLLLAGCAPLPESYRVPEQRSMKDAPEPEPLGAFVNFSDARAQDYVVDGFLSPAPDQTWRWASEKPTVRLRVSRTAGLRLRVNFALPEESHKPLLPVTVRYYVNDKLLDTVVYRQAGMIEYRKTVPGEWLSTENDNLVRCETSPVYVAKADGVKLSMIVAEIGLEPNE